MYAPKSPSVTVPPLNSRFAYRVISVVLAFFVLWQLLRLHQSFPAWLASVRADPAQSPCGDPNLKGLDDVLVVLKTGANEAPEKLPAHFGSTLRCVPHYAIYSDLEETVDGHQVHNVLEQVDPDIQAAHPDFQYYRQLQKYGRNGFSKDQLEGWSAAANTVNGRDSPGWRLDKWKFLPMAEEALQRKPEAKWYVFMEADTYVIWRNIVEWLAQFNPAKPYYLGLQMQIGDIIFGYGGAGFVLSHKALERLVEFRNSSKGFYDEYTATHWAGDCVMGKALKDSGIGLSWSWPTLISENPTNMNYEENFGSMDKKLWCHYAATYHHLSPEEVIRFSMFEDKWNAAKNDMMRHKDFFRYYVLPQMSEEHADWDNLADSERGSNLSFEDCRDICENKPDCYQFSLTGQTCRIGNVIRLGRQSVPTEDGERVTSGWMMDRVNAWVKRMDKSCNRHQKWALP